jgi:sigma-E factor negative regulatory protein RseC
MAKIMEHEAEIVEICAEEKRIEAEMIVSSACGGCKAKEICGKSESQRRRVTIYNDHPELYQVGQQITVYIEEVMGIKAVLYSYIAPFVLMLIALFVTNPLGELVSGLSALGACALYYVVLAFFRKRLEKVIVFRIKPPYLS